MPVKDIQSSAQAELQTQRYPGMKNLFGQASSQSTAPRDRENRAYPR
jgi:hypothetical protein